jgi:hypothetical protein
MVNPFQTKRKHDFLDQPPSGPLGRDAVRVRKVTASQFDFTGWNGLIDLGPSPHLLFTLLSLIHLAHPSSALQTTLSAPRHWWSRQCRATERRKSFRIKAETNAFVAKVASHPVHPVPPHLPFLQVVTPMPRDGTALTRFYHA